MNNCTLIDECIEKIDEIINRRGLTPETNDFCYDILIEYMDSNKIQKDSINKDGKRLIDIWREKRYGELVGFLRIYEEF